MKNSLPFALLLCITFVVTNHFLYAQTGCWLEQPPDMDPENTLKVVNTCPDDPGFPSEADMAGKDVKIVMPKDRICGETMLIGGTLSNPVHNVWIVGGKIEWTGPQKPSPGGAITLRQFDGTVFIEGIEIDVHNAYMDGVRCYRALGPDARVVIQNAYIRGMGYDSEGTHGDMFHAQGGTIYALSEFVMQNTRGDLINQGIFVPYRENTHHGARRMELDHVELRLDSRYKWGKISTMIFADKYGSPGEYLLPDGQSYNEVYLNWWDPHYPNAAERKNITVPPVDHYDENGCAVLSADIVEEGNITGKWCKGSPPDGTFVPLDKIGLNYNRWYFDSCHGSHEASVCFAPTPPIIDGIKEDSWDSIPADTIKRNIYGTPTSDDDLSATFKTRWDDESLYMLVDVKDDTLRQESGGLPWEDDAIEVFIDGNNDKASGYDDDDRRYIFAHDNDTVYSYQDTALPVNPDGITFGQTTTTSGYRMEIKLNWNAIGISPSAGHVIGFDMRVHDDDTGGTDDKSIAWIPSMDSSNHKPSGFGTKILDERICGAAQIISNPKDLRVTYNTDSSFIIQAIHADDYQWQVNQGAQFTDLSNNTTYTGAQTDTLHIAKANFDISGYQYRCIVSNAVGSDTSKVATLVVKDEESPEILSSLDDQILEAHTNCQVSLPDYTADLEVTDNYDQDLEISQSPAPGTSIGNSPVEVTITVSDDFNNTTEQLFTVQAVDQTPPEINSTHDDQSLEAGPDCQATLPDYTTTVVATDNCYRSNEIKISQTPAPYTTISDTSITVTLTIADPEENNNEISFHVTLIDQIIPTISCPEDQFIDLQSGEQAYTVSGTAFDPVSTGDNCSVDSIINDFNQGSTLAGAEFPADTTSVIWIVTDNSGNKGQCSFDVVVNAPTRVKSLAKSDIQLYPNPTDNIIYYESLKSKIHKLSLFELTGNKILEKNVQQYKGSIDISHLNKGLYLIQLNTSDGIKTIKIIKE